MLELRNINKAFAGKTNLTNFSLSLLKANPAIVGPSGGGKTTLLRMLAGWKPSILEKSTIMVNL